MSDIQRNVIKHAQADMAADPAMSHDTTAAKAAAPPASQRPGFWAQMAAIGREAIKDIRQTANEVFFGSGEHGAEPGTPLNPTQIMVTDELRGGDAYARSVQRHAARATPDKDQTPTL